MAWPSNRLLLPVALVLLTILLSPTEQSSSSSSSELLPTTNSSTILIRQPTQLSLSKSLSPPPPVSAGERDLFPVTPSSISNRIQCNTSLSYAAATAKCGAICKTLEAFYVGDCITYPEPCCMAKDKANKNGFCYCCRTGSCKATDNCASVNSNNDCIVMTYANFPCSQIQLFPSSSNC